MQRKPIYGTLLFILGTFFGAVLGGAWAATEAAKPAYLIVSSDRNPGITADDYAPYLQAAGPLAREAGLSMLATAQSPEVLEGAWPYGNVAIERFSSMTALKEFWFSAAYQQAITLRAGLSTINFIVAVEGE